MKYKTPELRYTNTRILGDVGFAHLLIASAVLPVVFGMLAILAFGPRQGSAIWMALQVSIVGTAVGAYLSKLRGTLGEFEKATCRDQRDLDYSPLVKRLYRNPVLEYWVLGWGTLAARTFVFASSALAASLLGDLSLPWALAIASVLQLFESAAVFVLGAAILAKVMSGVFLGTLPMLGQLSLPTFGNVSVGLLILALAVIVGQFQKVRSTRWLGEQAGQDQRELASGSSFYVAHEVIRGFLMDALNYGGGLERARDGITLATVESQATLKDTGWKPAVGDLHKGQTVDTSELVAALREAANADTMKDPEQAPSPAEAQRVEAA